MADIFVSYAREDRDAVRALATQLERRGWTVWWDRHILAGKEYDEVIQREIDAARSVVVVWSQHSVASRWVKAEADEGARRRILVPIALDDSSLPLGFRNIQTVTFSGVDPGLDSVPFRDLVDAIADVAGTPPPRPSPQPRGSLTPSPREAPRPAPDPEPPGGLEDPPDTDSHARFRGRHVLAIAGTVAIVVVAAVVWWPRTHAPTPDVAPSPGRAPAPAASKPASPASSKIAEVSASAAADPASAASSLLADTSIREFVTRLVAAGNTADADQFVAFYADRVDYYTMGLVDLTEIRKDKAAYYRRWPEVRVQVIDIQPPHDGPSTGTKSVTFTSRYEVSSAARNAHASGTVTTSLVVAPIAGALKIIGEKEVVESDKKGA